MLSKDLIKNFTSTKTPFYYYDLDLLQNTISALKKEGLLTAKGKKLGIPNISEFSAQLQDTAYFLEG